MAKIVLVLGSNSFTGAHFVAGALNSGFDVIGISRSNQPNPAFLPYEWQTQKTDRFVFLQLDLNQDLKQIFAIINEKKPEYIVNFAAQGMVAPSWGNPEQWIQTNTLSAVKLHHYLKDCTFIKKFVQISTPEVYGSCSGVVKENNNYNPSTPYAVSKAAADMSLMTYANHYNFPVVFTRAANVYGEGQQLYRIVPKTILLFKTGGILPLHGGGRSVRSFVHIKDVVSGTLNVMRKGSIGQVYHLSSDTHISIRNLVQHIADKMKVSFQKHIETVDDRPGKDDAYYLDCSKIKNEFGWEAQIDLNRGIDKTISWIEKNLDIFKKLEWEYIHKP